MELWAVLITTLLILATLGLYRLVDRLRTRS
jgi:hypothetical protein